MPRKRFTSEQIITILREAEILVNQGPTFIEAVRKLGISEQTYYRWRKEYGGMRVDQTARRNLLQKLQGNGCRSLGLELCTLNRDVLGIPTATYTKSCKLLIRLAITLFSRA
jgi:hypothetical protein